MTENSSAGSEGENLQILLPRYRAALQPNSEAGMTERPDQVIVITERGGPGFLVRIVWYIFIGWWLSGLAIALGWLLAVTIIGLPLAFMIFNRIPAIMTLRGRTVTYEATVKDGTTYYRARFAGLNKDQAEAVCSYLKRNDVECVAIKN